jgi:hypothetical protein
MNNVYGMRSGYTCCLANMHQGWTKFASHLWYATRGNGLAAFSYSPNQIKMKVGKANTEVTINEVTSYPFEDEVNFELTTKREASFPFELRIPVWCKEATVFINGKVFQTGKGGQMITVERTWKSGDKLTLKMPMEVTTSNWGRNSRSVERGPLVYALKLEEKWEKGNDEKEGEYFNVFPKQDWNYGLTEVAVKQPVQNIQFTQVKPVTASFIWNLQHAPIELTIPARKIPEWKLSNDVAPQPVTDRTGIYRGNVSSELERVTLVPYGCTKVRVVAFPVVK